MVAAQKAKSKIEETWERVRGNVTVTAEPVKGVAEVKQHINKLISPWPREDKAVITPALQAALGGMDMDVDMIEEPAILNQS